ncbi:MAG: hypothetical protein ABR910_11685 [Acidobacteriaceae bacterium]
MSERARRLERLLAIRRLGEELGRRRLQTALGAVAEVEAAIGAQDARLVEAKVESREALAAGDRGEWLMADARGEVAGWNKGRLGYLLRERMSEVPPAMEMFLESRREHEQVKQLVEDARGAARVEEDRRAQAAADEWFASRRGRQGGR